MKDKNRVKSILYVEDEKAIQEELAEFLEMYCEELHIADDGVQGIEQYKKYKPDLIVTDIKMPIMDGIMMSKKIKEINENVYIIFTTAFSDIGFFQEAIELQVDGYILKPIDLDLLDKKIKNIIKNIEVKKELEQKEQMLIQQSKLASMGEMIGNIAHQWRQPLSIIAMNVNHIKVDCELDEIRKDNLIDYSRDITNQVNYLSKTIDDFRNFFKPTNKDDIFNIKDFINKCVYLVKAAFDDNMIETIKDIDENLQIKGNSNQLSQALINILNNAKDALKEAQDIHKKLVFIVTVKKDDNHNVVITVKDNAGGIPENIIDRIFEPYFTTKHQSTGTGLGLYITNTIVTKNLGGTIIAENEVFDYEGTTYKGAKFTITLPLV